MKIHRFLAGTAIAVILFAAAAFSQGSRVTIRLQPFLSGLSSPVFMTNAGDGTNRLFVVQQGGQIRVVQPGSTTPTTFLNISTVISAGGERGLLGLAFHPQYEVNRRFFVYYTRAGDGAITIAQYQASVADPNVADPAGTVIITIPHPGFSNHNGGSIAFGPDGYLYAGPGDGGGGNDTANNAQNINVLLGKIIRIDIDSVPGGYASPPDNPFVGTAGRDEIYATGMRNPYRFSFDRGGAQQLWVGDVGQNAWEEVDIITNGGNYGWRIYEGNHCTGNDPCVFPPNYVGPILEYSISGSRCAITGGYVYRGTQNHLPQGSYVYADYCTGEILLWHNNTQNFLLDSPYNISGFGEGETGEVYIIGLGGTVHKILKANTPAEFGEPVETQLETVRPSTGGSLLIPQF